MKKKFRVLVKKGSFFNPIDNSKDFRYYIMKTDLFNNKKLWVRDNFTEYLDVFGEAKHKNIRIMIK